MPKLSRSSRSALISILLSVVASCSKPEPAPKPTIAASDHVAPSPVGTTQTVLEKTFNLKGVVIYPFEIPPHAVQPHLHGIFESFVGQVHGTSDENADIDFLIMNAEQQADLAASRASEAMFSVEASHNQAVNFDLPASMNQPVKYYLVFRSPEKSRNNKVVEAHFRVDF